MTSDVSWSRVAVVTGGARGIGLAIGRWFLANGHAVALIDIDGETLAKAATSLADEARVLPVVCDIADPAQVDAAIARIAARFGRIDALVNNAGVAVFKPHLRHVVDEWRRVLAPTSTAPSSARRRPCR